MDIADSALQTRWPSVPLRRLTVSDYRRMADVGILGARERLELIEGLIVAKPAIGSSHMATVNALTRLLVMAIGDRGIVSIQNPVQLDDYSEPEPDVAVLAPRTDFYRSAIPRAGDVFLLIEVSDTSLEFDRDVKLPLYARNGIAEYWIADIEANEIEICRAPLGDTYASRARVGVDRSVDIARLPGSLIPVAAVFC
jgi:Uma2 family endonuclease